MDSKKNGFITAETRIGRVVMLKGESVSELLDDFFCLDTGGRKKRCCCVGCSVTLVHGAHLRKKTAQLPAFIDQLNALPDIPR